MPEIRWTQTEWRSSVGSTNVEALADPRPGRVLVADHQSAGLGRRGRGWEAPPGTALAVSVVVPAPSGTDLGWVPLVAGLAVAQALQASRYAVSARLKWPNDVLVPEQGVWRKVCGVLAQTQQHPEHGAVVVVGAGLNVDQTREQLPVESATSWRLARGGAVLPDEARAHWLQRYLDHLQTALADLSGARAAYRRSCDTLGRTVLVQLPGGVTRQGRAVEVDAGGALVVEEDGRRVVHHAGDVVHLRPGD